MPTLHIDLLGEFRLVLGETPLTTFQSERLQSLLVYLLLHRSSPQPRLHLAFLLWPDSTESQARTNLRNLLHQLRRALPEAEQFVELDSSTLQWRADAPVSLDVAQFQEALSRAKSSSDPQTARQAWEEAVTVYKGDLLPSNYEEWILPVREELRQNFLAALEQLALLLEEAGDFRAAIRYAQRLVQVEPLQESSYVQLMRLHALNGDRAGVTRVYQACVAVLERELDVEPSTATREAYERLLRTEAAPTPLQPLPQRQPAPPEPPRTATPSRLPTQATPFIGREEELAELAALLGSPECRLLTLVGLGGTGKTRLALQAAAQQLPAFADGACFVPLTSVATADLLVPSIANAIALTFYGPADPKTQLFNHLRDKQMLLLLDNFEHLLEGADLLTELLQAAPQVKLLVTSRERLNLLGEWLFEVQGLPVPEETQAAALEENSALMLFVQSARRVRPGFALTPTELPSIIRICQLMGGMPLGIELAAAWVRLLPADEIAREIESNLDFLTTATRDIPARHRSTRAVFDHSWKMLSEEEACVLSHLSVFRGGFRREAAEQVADASLGLISALLDKSLLRRADSGRYDMHEVVRQFAAERLEADPNDAASARERHSHFYTTLLQQQGQRLRTEEQPEALVTLNSEVDNIRAAWEWAVAHQSFANIRQASRSLVYFYLYRSWFQEGAGMFKRAANRVEASIGYFAEVEQLDPAAAAALGSVLVGHGYFNWRLGQYSQAEALLQRSVPFLRYVNDLNTLSDALAWLGIITHHQGRYAEAQTILEESVTVYEQAGNQWGEAYSLVALGQLKRTIGDYEEAEPLLKKGLALFRRSGDSVMVTMSLSNLAWALIEKREYHRAQPLLEESLALGRAAKDPWAIGIALELMQQIAQALGNFDEAQQLLHESLGLFVEMGEYWHRTQLLNDLGHMSITLSQWEEARQAFTEALQLASSAKLAPRIYDSLVGFARLRLQAGHPEQALELVSHVLHQPSVTQIVRSRADKLCADLVSLLEPEVERAATARGQQQTTDEVVAALLKNVTLRAA